MRKLILKMSMGIALIGIVSGCMPVRAEESELRRVVIENLRAAEEEDLEAYMATLDESAPSYESSERMMGQTFRLYDIRYQLDSFRVVEVSGDEAVIEVVQTTMKVKGPAFRNNKIRARHRLVKTDGKWKFLSSELISVEYLDD